MERMESNIAAHFNIKKKEKDPVWTQKLDTEELLYTLLIWQRVHGSRWSVSTLQFSLASKTTHRMGESKTVLGREGPGISIKLTLCIEVVWNGKNRIVTSS